MSKKINTENMQPNILYYSKQCVHSKRFRQMLMKKPDLESTFIQLCVDSGGKIPPFVKQVPFIVVYDERGQPLRLTDSSAFNWLNQRMEQLAGDFKAYDSGVMSSSLSDNYSYISENGANLTTSHQFEWINDKEKPFLGSFGESINTPNESTFGGGNDKAPKSDMEKIMEQRNRDLPNFSKPAEIDFSKPFSQQPQSQQPRSAASYTPSVRKQEARIAPPQRGVDFQNPAFQNRIAQQPQQRFQPQHPQQSQQRQQQQSPFQRPPVNQPIHRQVQGRALPSGWSQR